MADRRGRQPVSRRYPRVARVNHVVQQIVAEALELVADDDTRLELVTVTGVDTDPDLRHATVYYSARTEGADEALMEHRVALQAAIAKQTRLKRTPQLSFAPDPAVTTGWRIETILKGIVPATPERDAGADDV